MVDRNGGVAGHHSSKGHNPGGGDGYLGTDCGLQVDAPVTGEATDWSKGLDNTSRNRPREANTGQTGWNRTGGEQ